MGGFPSLYFFLLLLCTYITLSSMRSLAKKTRAEQRRINHQGIFSLNRKYRQRLQDIKKEHFRITNDYEIDPAYKTLLQTLKKIRYDRNQIKELLDLLEDEDFVKVYQGMIGLSSFGDGLINIQNEDEILAIGLVPKLMQLIFWKDHPYLQICCLNILKSASKVANTQNFRAYFNSTTIPYSFIIDAMRFNKSIFYEILKFYRALNNRVNFFDNSDVNLAFLHKIESLFLTIQEDPYCTTKLQMISWILTEIKVNFWASRRRFASKYYGIRHKLLGIYKKKGMIDEIVNQIRYIYDKQRVRMLFSAINQYPQEMEDAAQYAQEIINIPFEIKFQSNTSVFSIFFGVLIEVKQTKKFLPRQALLDRIIPYIISQTYKNNGYTWHPTVECISILLYILRSDNNEFLQIALQNTTLLNHLESLYKSSYYKKLYQQLNSFVIFLVKQSNKAYVMKILQEYEFIETYFKKSYDYDQMTAKGALKNLQWTLGTIKAKNQDQYQQIRKLIVTDKNYKKIQNIKSNTYLSKMGEIFDFYFQMKNEENKNLIQKHQALIQICNPGCNNEPNKQKDEEQGNNEVSVELEGPIIDNDNDEQEEDEVYCLNDGIIDVDQICNVIQIDD